jgi:hypothetical protein
MPPNCSSSAMSSVSHRLRRRELGPRWLELSERSINLPAPRSEATPRTTGRQLLSQTPGCLDGTDQPSRLGGYSIRRLRRRLTVTGPNAPRAPIARDGRQHVSPNRHRTQSAIGSVHRSCTRFPSTPWLPGLQDRHAGTNAQLRRHQLDDVARSGPHLHDLNPSDHMVVWVRIPPGHAL